MDDPTLLVSHRWQSLRHAARHTNKFIQDTLHAHDEIEKIQFDASIEQLIRKWYTQTIGIELQGLAEARIATLDLALGGTFHHTNDTILARMVDVTTRHDFAQTFARAVDAHILATRYIRRTQLVGVTFRQTGMATVRPSETTLLMARLQRAAAINLIRFGVVLLTLIHTVRWIDTPTLATGSVHARSQRHATRSLVARSHTAVLRASKQSIARDSTRRRRIARYALQQLVSAGAQLLDESRTRRTLLLGMARRRTRVTALAHTRTWVWTLGQDRTTTRVRRSGGTTARATETIAIHDRTIATRTNVTESVAAKAKDQQQGEKTKIKVSI